MPVSRFSGVQTTLKSILTKKQEFQPASSASESGVSRDSRHSTSVTREPVVRLKSLVASYEFEAEGYKALYREFCELRRLQEAEQKARRRRARGKLAWEDDEEFAARIASEEVKAGLPSSEDAARQKSSPFNGERFFGVVDPQGWNKEEKNATVQCLECYQKLGVHPLLTKKSMPLVSVANKKKSLSYAAVKPGMAMRFELELEVDTSDSEFVYVGMKNTELVDEKTKKNHSFQVVRPTRKVTFGQLVEEEIFDRTQSSDGIVGKDKVDKIFVTAKPGKKYRKTPRKTPTTGSATTVKKTETKTPKKQEGKKLSIRKAPR